MNPTQLPGSIYLRQLKGETDRIWPDVAVAIGVRAGTAALSGPRLGAMERGEVRPEGTGSIRKLGTSEQVLDGIAIDRLSRILGTAFPLK